MQRLPARARTHHRPPVVIVRLDPTEARYIARVCGGCSAREIVLQLAQQRLLLRRARAGIAA